MGRRTLRKPAPPTIVLAALAIAAIVVAIVVVGSPATSNAQERTVTVARGVVQSTVSASGNLAPANQLDIDFATSGEITHIYVKQGEHVSEGQRLATIDDSSKKVDLAEAKADLQSAQDTLDEVQLRVVVDGVVDLVEPDRDHRDDRRRLEHGHRRARRTVHNARGDDHDHDARSDDHDARPDDHDHDAEHDDGTQRFRQWKQLRRRQRIGLERIGLERIGLERVGLGKRERLGLGERELRREHRNRTEQLRLGCAQLGRRRLRERLWGWERWQWFWLDDVRGCR